MLFETQPRSHHSRMWLCRCVCGREQEVYQGNLLRRKNPHCMECSKTLRCKPEGWAYTREVYKGMITRCQNHNHINYSHYGGRGITVCDRWLEPDGRGFLNFLEDMGNRPEGMTLDRVDNNGNYEPSNCRWTSKSEQSYNTRRKSHNTSGRTGVSFNKALGKWEVYISAEGEFIKLGYFSDFEEACAIRSEAELKYYGKNKE